MRYYAIIFTAWKLMALPRLPLLPWRWLPGLFFLSLDGRGSGEVSHSATVRCRNSTLPARALVRRRQKTIG